MILDLDLVYVERCYLQIPRALDHCTKHICRIVTWPISTVQQQWNFLAQIFDNRIGAALDLQAGRNGVQFDIGFDLSGRRVNLLGLFIRPHGGAELCLAKWPLESWNVDAHVWICGGELTRTSGNNSLTVGATSSIAGPC